MLRNTGEMQLAVFVLKGFHPLRTRQDPNPWMAWTPSDFLARKGTFGSLLLRRFEEAGPVQQKRAQRLGESGCVMVL